jgi:hypothetical protein
MRELKRFIGTPTAAGVLVFRYQRGSPLLETTILSQCSRSIGTPQGRFPRFPQRM